MKHIALPPLCASSAHLLAILLQSTLLSEELIMQVYMKGHELWRLQYYLFIIVAKVRGSQWPNA